MRIIISPAKKMVEEADVAHRNLPVFIDRAEVLRKWICSLSYDEKKRLWACSDAIATQNADRFAHMDLHSRLVPALLAYDGIQYSYMAPTVFEDGHFDYVQDHLRILSGFYGVLRPFDGVVPYRLEMQAKAAVAGCSNLYEFWGNSIYREVVRGDHLVVNLASNEYSKAVKRHLEPGDTFVTCTFGELQNNKVVQKGVYVKMARGEMVRYLADIHATNAEQLKGFVWSGYAYDDERSTPENYVFVR